MSEVKKAVEKYVAEGWPVIPLAPKAKNPYHKNWRTRDFEIDDWNEADNVGLHLRKGWVDIDLDCDEAVAMSTLFLPNTGRVFGRASKPKSHWLYICDEIREPIVYKEPNGKVLLEIRTEGDQETMIPPSVHPSGELVDWYAESAPAKLEAKDLKRAAALLATAALLAKRYPPSGARHEFFLALFGAFRQWNFKIDEAEKVIEAAAKLAGDEKIQERKDEELFPTFRRSGEDPMAGIRKLKELDKDFFESILPWVGGSASIGGFLVNPNNGKVYASEPENIRRALVKLDVRVKWNLFTKRKELYQNEQRRELDDATLNTLRFTINERFRFMPPKELFFDYVDSYARQDSYHPVRDWLDSLSWDGVERLDSWLVTYCGASDSDYTRAVGRLPLLAAVKRVFEPGAKFDELLILEGRTGCGKSTAISNLCPVTSWFSDDLPLSVDSKQVIERTAGRWIIEVAELVGQSKREVEHVKAFLSRQTDGPVRMAYAREPIHIPRQWVGIGTTNRGTFLRDPTGNRRFWPVHVGAEGMIDTDGIARDRDQLWAEARARFSKESLRLDSRLWEKAAEQQEARMEVDPWEEVLAKTLEDPPHEWWRRTSGRGGGAIDYAHPEIRCTLSDVYELLGIFTERQTAQSAERIRNVMGRLGFEYKKVTKSERGFVRKEDSVPDGVQ